jgi:N-acetylmuramoyl-L-alanine amidase
VGTLVGPAKSGLPPRVEVMPRRPAAFRSSGEREEVGSGFPGREGPQSGLSSRLPLARGLRGDEASCRPGGPTHDNWIRSQTDTCFPLARGDSGQAVRDLQHRLARLGHDCGAEIDRGFYGPTTAAAVANFQASRGLRADSRCTAETWSTVVEAGWRSGERLLYRRNPMLRGDDVAELQTKLSILGFDTSGIDGIFGDETAAATAELQRNLGVLPDGICGPRTWEQLNLLCRDNDTMIPAATLREHLRHLERGNGLAGLRVVVGESGGGGFAAGVTATARALSRAGAVTLTVHDPDESRQAGVANAFRADCYIGLTLTASSTALSTTYYAGFRYESTISKRLAEIVQARLPRAVDAIDGGVRGMAFIVLRETKMPAICIDIGRPALAVQRATEIASAILSSLNEWLQHP